MGTIQIDGSTPKLTIGNATAEDALILFDGNAQDYHVGLDDSSDSLVIGLGSALGTTPAMTVNSSQVVTFAQNPVFPDGGVAVADLDIDGATDIGAAIVDADLFIVDDGAGGTNRKVTASRLKTYAGTTINNATANEIVTIGSTTTELDAEANLTFSGSALQCTATLTVGVDDTGHDVKFFGATASSHMLWDESADDLNLVASGLGVGAVGTKDLGEGIHIKKADSSATADSEAALLVLEDGTSGAANGISILSATNGYGTIYFGDSGNDDIGKIYYNHGDNSMVFQTSDANAIVIDGAGTVTKPLQPVFLVTKSGHQNDIAINATTTITFDTERIDINADFASNTFTAPVTGSYQFNFTITWGAYDTDFGYQYTMFVASNRTVYAHLGSGNQITADGYYNSGGSCVIDMDANDTCLLKVQFSNDGAAQADASQSSYFSGFLIG
jgi:hypothetical protein